LTVPSLPITIEDRLNLRMSCTAPGRRTRCRGCRTGTRDQGAGRRCPAARR
jgi:hypothetical protein